MRKVFFTILSFVLVPVHFMHAESGEITNPLGISSVEELVKKILDIITQIALPFIVLAFVYTGFLFVKARGAPDELEKARKALLYTVIGALILLGAELLTDAIGGTIDELQNSPEE